MLATPFNGTLWALMAMFVHIAPESRTKAILRSGISRTKQNSPALSGVYALPVTRNFYISHQWLRELARTGRGPFAGVYFRIPDDELVSLGHYMRDPEKVTAAEAVAVMMACESREGYQVFISRRILPREIHRIRRLPQVVGWRYFPGAHSKRPCGCDYCQGGNYGARKLREEYESRNA